MSKPNIPSVTIGNEMTATSKVRRRLAIAGTAAVVTTLAACGSAGGPADASQELRVGMPVTILSVDPHGNQIAERTTQVVTRHVFDPLVRMEDGEPVGALAESWENANPNRWEFTLREDVTFHDGSELTSEDVRASLERMFQADTSFSPLWNKIAAVETPAADTVVITTAEPYGALLTNLSLVGIGSAAQIESGDIEGSQPIGTGPFKLEEFSPGSRTVLAANADHWDGAPEVEQLELQEIPETTSRVTALETGEIDVTYAVPPDQIAEVQAFDDVTLDLVPGLVNYFIWFNNEVEPFDDVQVRQALWHAIDFESIQSELFGEAAALASAPVPQAAFGAADLARYEYDPARAQELLADAGYPDGFETSIQWSSESAPNIRQMTQAMISDLSKVNVMVEPLEKERGQWLDDLLSLNFDMNIQSNPVTTGDAGYAIGRLYTCAAERLGYCSDEFDAAIAEAESELDVDSRRTLLAEAQAVLWDDAPAMFPLDLTANAAWRSHVTGFEPAPDDIPDFRDVSITE